MRQFSWAIIFLLSTFLYGAPKTLIKKVLKDEGDVGKFGFKLPLKGPFSFRFESSRKGKLRVRGVNGDELFILGKYRGAPGPVVSLLSLGNGKLSLVVSERPEEKPQLAADQDTGEIEIGIPILFDIEVLLPKKFFHHFATKGRVLDVEIKNLPKNSVSEDRQVFLNLEGRSGIKMSNVMAGGDVVMLLQSGDIELGSVYGNNIFASTKNGYINASRCSGKATLLSAYGRVSSNDHMGTLMGGGMAVILPSNHGVGNHEIVTDLSSGGSSCRFPVMEFPDVW